MPFTTKSKRGLDTRVSLKQALTNQGFVGNSKHETEWSLWVESEKEALSKVMEITYRTVGDYRIPNLDLPEEAKVPLGRWGTAHKDYLMYHRPVTFTTMLADGTLWKHLQEVDEQAEKMFNQLVKEICENENINE